MLPIISIVGASNSGKTTYLERLIPELRQRGYRVGTLKHDVHGFEMDREGKDTWRHRKAGAQTIAIASPVMLGAIREIDAEMPVEQIAGRIHAVGEPDKPQARILAVVQGIRVKIHPGEPCLVRLGAHAVPARRHVAAARDLAVDRFCRLFLLQSLPQPSGATPSSRVDHAGTRWQRCAAGVEWENMTERRCSLSL